MDLGTQQTLPVAIIVRGPQQLQMSAGYPIAFDISALSQKTFVTILTLTKEKMQYFEKQRGGTEHIRSLGTGHVV